MPDGEAAQYCPGILSAGEEEPASRALAIDHAGLGAVFGYEHDRFAQETDVLVVLARVKTVTHLNDVEIMGGFDRGLNRAERVTL